MKFKKIVIISIALCLCSIGFSQHSLKIAWQKEEIILDILNRIIKSNKDSNSLKKMFLTCLIDTRYREFDYLEESRYIMEYAFQRVIITILL